MTSLPGSRVARSVPLVVAIAAALPAALPAFARNAPAASNSQRPGVIALHDQLRSLMPIAATVSAPAQTRSVGSCADDGGALTLRAAVAVAGDADTIDLSQVACSRMPLTQGALPGSAG